MKLLRRVSAAAAALAKAGLAGYAWANDKLGQPTPGAIDFQPGVTPLRQASLFLHNAILMPVIAVRRIVGDYRSELGRHGEIALSSDAGRELIGLLIDAFAVSEEAARVRLIKLGLLTTGTPQPSVFG